MCGYCARLHPCIIFPPVNAPLRWLVLLFLFYRGGSCGVERAWNLFKVTQLKSMAEAWLVLRAPPIATMGHCLYFHLWLMWTAY